ncbi:thiaminase II [Bacillus massiliglaciei]|uniref:thiaminase II n=1 Tax=Bacillus massiliglaciei TaxID=1816693 RepID=UPI000DA5F645|nr:thiaminase II [Bacillus massiliglaciei]
MTFCREIRKETDLYWERSFQHPFVKGIADGSLPMGKFKFYMMQDAYYLKAYTKVLSIMASKAETNEEIAYFLEKAHSVHEAELGLHRTVFRQLGVTEADLKDFEPAPSAYNYVSHLYSTAYNGDLAEAFAAVLPCPWLYQEIGERYRKAKPGVRLYEEWIAMYSSADFKETIEREKVMMNRYAEQNPKKVRQLKSHFEKSCYYEWKFWEMPWTLENWKGKVNDYVSI